MKLAADHAPVRHALDAALELDGRRDRLRHFREDAVGVVNCGLGAEVREAIHGLGERHRVHHILHSRYAASCAGTLPAVRRLKQQRGQQAQRLRQRAAACSECSSAHTVKKCE